MISNTIKQKLLTALAVPLPGTSAHQKMSVPDRSHYSTIPFDAKKAAVLILLYHRIDRTFISFIRRKLHDADHHSGQISFPGGKMEATDDYPIQTAVREAIEEIGITENLEILGKLSPLYIPISNFYVSPVIAWHHDTNPCFKIQHDEVDELIEIELSLIQDSSLKKHVNIPFGTDFILNDVPAYVIHGQVIWGATAMILSEVEWILQ